MKTETTRLRERQVYYFKNIDEDKAKQLFDVAFRDDVQQIVTPNGMIWKKGE